MTSRSVPDKWITIKVEPFPATPTEGYDYSLFCSAILVAGFEITPNITWLDPEGISVHNSIDAMFGNVYTLGNKTTQVVNFVPVDSTHGGEYTCSVSIAVPYMNVTLSEVVGWSVIVTSRSCTATHSHVT